MQKILNVGCGSKTHKLLDNIDLVSDDPIVKTYDIKNGLPYPDGTFDAVYHSQVLEHINYDMASNFIKECWRVLKPGGVIRIVVPDLEEIAREYLKKLESVLDNPSELEKADYEWITIELIDQLTRSRPGGRMKRYLDGEMINRSYIEDRIGPVHSSGVRAIPPSNTNKGYLKRYQLLLNKTLRFVRSKLFEFPFSEAAKVGQFRTSGEPHLWMYDRYSLPLLLKNSDFIQISIENAFESSIPDWSVYGLDSCKGKGIDPKSLFCEAVKA
jgi:predicted SAM-dependent methyltransferase